MWFDCENKVEYTVPLSVNVDDRTRMAEVMKGSAKVYANTVNIFHL